MLAKRTSKTKVTALKNVHKPLEILSSVDRLQKILEKIRALELDKKDIDVAVRRARGR